MSVFRHVIILALVITACINTSTIANEIAKLSNLNGNSAKDVKFDSFDEGDGGENHVGSVQI